MTREIEMFLDLSSTSQLQSAHEPIRCTHHKWYYIWIIMISFKHIQTSHVNLVWLGLVVKIFSTEIQASPGENPLIIIHRPALSFAALLWQVCCSTVVWFPLNEFHSYVEGAIRSTVGFKSSPLHVLLPNWRLRLSPNSSGVICWIEFDGEWKSTKKLTYELHPWTLA